MTVDGKGRVFFNVEGQQVRRDILERVGKHYNLTFDEKELKRFSVLASVGMPSPDIKKYLNSNDDERRQMNTATKGIPVDSLNNELSIWINAARNVAPRYSIAIKGDKDADIPTVKRVISILQDNKANRFALITNLEGQSEEPAKK